MQTRIGLALATNVCQGPFLCGDTGRRITLGQTMATARANLAFRMIWKRPVVKRNADSRDSWVVGCIGAVASILAGSCIAVGAGEPA